MQQFSLHSSKVKIISSIIFLISACSIFFAFGILADNLIVKILSFLIFGFCFADLLPTFNDEVRQKPLQVF